MAKVLAGITVSLDGYINDSNGSVDQLYTDFAELKAAHSFQKMIADTGAVIMGRNVYEMADPFTWVNEEYEFQVPLFILTHTPPEKFPQGNEKLSVTFVTDGIESAISQAKKAATATAVQAGDKMVQVIGGANTIQQALNSGLCDELGIDVMSVFLGGGKRLFENIDREKVKLKKIKVEEVTPLRTSLLYTITK